MRRRGCARACGYRAQRERGWRSSLWSVKITRLFGLQSSKFRRTTVRLDGATTIDRTRTPKAAWLIVALLFSFMLFNSADKAVIGIAAVPIMQELMLSPSEFGLIGSSFYVLFALSAIVTGFATAVIVQGGGLGVMVALPLLNWVIVHYSWHWAFGALSVAGLVWTAAWLARGRQGSLASDALTVRRRHSGGSAMGSWR
jgi:hypothetical protein